MPGSRAPSDARTQGPLGLDSPGATEDAAARRVIAGEKPECVAGRGTLNFHCHAQTRRRRARILRDLVLTRTERLPAQRAHHRLVAAHTDREVGRAGAAAFGLAHELLDDAVLE